MEGEIITIETAQKLAEYDKLKKQYEKVLNDYCRLDAYNRTQQKEFIKYLEEEISKWHYNYDSNTYEYELEEPTAEDYANEILQKYKSTIGDGK